ncbi:discoidin domain-containing protein [Paenibacillus aceris]|uniref:Beta-N-acetylhexosaminidase n=1 Tax=Paenibacillus aceris TaxID=869555 RepID=A0ABS4HWZ7_9BACL|nr:discoidin domain-containing protein [Paenibacillus aceris]MBP1963182.1 hypothetical protein [Paenibacillus aceris]NHW38701.1 family 20 glycosylhydrolase [Paenibacillus aceris]
MFHLFSRHKRSTMRSLSFLLIAAILAAFIPAGAATYAAGEATNLAAGKSVTVSSENATKNKKENAVDGNMTTPWGSLYFDPEWIYVDLGKAYSVSKVKIYWEAAYGKGYKIQVSQDAMSWTDVFATQNGDGGLDEINFEPVEARYVKMLGVQKATKWGYTIYEYEVYGVPVTLKAPTLSLSAETWTNSTVAFTIGDYDPSALTAQYKLGVSGQWLDYTGEVSLNGEGVVDVYARVKDAEGNVSAAVQRTSRIDTTAPTPPSISSNEGETNTTIVISGGTDSASGVAGYEYKLSTGGTWLRYSEPLAISLLAPVTVSARTVDTAGNTSEVVSKTIEPLNSQTFMNLAKGKTAVSSSTDSAANKTENAIDGDTATRWASLKTNNEWIYVDLGKVSTVYSAKLNWEAAFAKAYKIQLSEDGVAWTDVYTTTKGAGGIEEISFDPVTARYVKMQGVERGTIYGYSLYEFEVYGYPARSKVTLQADAETWINRDVLVTAASQETGGEISYKVGETGAWQPYTAPVKIEQEGETKVFAKWADGSGNEGPTIYKTVHIDKTAPAAPYIHRSNVLTSKQDVTFTIAGGQDTGSGIQISQYKLNDAASWIDYTGQVTVSQEGETKVTARTIDKVGNVGPAASAVIRIDRSAANNPKPTVIPSLREWSGGTGTFQMTSASRIIIDPAYASQLAKTAETFKDDLTEITGFKLPLVSADTPQTGDFYLTLQNSDAEIGDEGYYFEIGDAAVIRANTPTGVFYGTRSALQILKQDAALSRLAKGVSRDYPKYKVRGMMLDVARKYFPMSFIRDHVKFMSWYKMNDFQIHLNDNFGTYSAFRLESETYPELTAKDGHYTKAEFRELQDMAAVQGVTITPEFDTPAHSLAFTNIKPEIAWAGDSSKVHLDLKNPETYKFVESLWDEYIPLFDSPNMHIGADEYDYSTAEIRDDFRAYVNHFNNYVKSKGKSARMWGSLGRISGPRPVDKDITVNIWDNDWQNPVTTINSGNDVINNYKQLLYIVPNIARYQSYLNTRKIYEEWEPNIFDFNNAARNTTTDEPHLLGGSYAVWNDTGGAGASIFDVHAFTKPATQVLGEKLWSGTTTGQSYADFKGLADKIDEAPGTNLLREVDTKGNAIIAYDFEEGSGTVAEDSSGNAYHGQLIEVSRTEEGYTGEGLSFNKANAHLETGLQSKGFPWSLSMRVKRENDAQQTDSILLESVDGALKLKQNGIDKLGFTREDGIGFTFNYTVPVGTWVQLTLEGDKSGTSLYVNGQFKQRLTNSFVLPLEKIGSSTSSFKGVLDDVRIFADVRPVETHNIALRKVSNASAVDISGNAGNNNGQKIHVQAFDGDTSTRWESKAIDDQWIDVDLGEIRTVNKVKLNWYTGMQAIGYTIQVSNDERTWTTVSTVANGDGGIDEIAFAPIQARYVKMQGTQRSPGKGYSLTEFEVYDASLLKWETTQTDLDAGQAVAMKAVLTAEGGAVDGSVRPVYKSFDNTVAEVNAEGLLTAKKAGQTWITASYGGQTAVMAFVVNDKPEATLSTISFDQEGYNVKVNDAVQMLVTANYSDGQAANVSALAQYSVENPSLAQIDANGLLHGLVEGNTVVTATYGGVTTSAAVQIEKSSTGINELNAVLTGPGTAKPGDPFTVRMGLKGVAKPIYAQDIHIRYEDSIFEFVEAKSLKTGVTILQTVRKPGEIRLITVSEGATHAIAADQDVIELTFAMKPSVVQTSGSIAAYDVTTADELGIETQAVPSSITIIQTPQAVGDLNHDGKVSIGDLAFAAAHYGKTTASPDWQQVKAADVSGDGTIGIDDLAAIASKILE